MSEKLDTPRAKAIYGKIEHEKERIRASKAAIRDSLGSTKNTVHHVVENPLKLISPEGLNARSFTPKALLNHPLSTSLGIMAVGWGMGYMLRNKRRRILRTISRPVERLAEQSLNSRLAQRVVNEFSSGAESVVGEIFSKARKTVEEFIHSWKNREQNSRSDLEHYAGDASSPNWEERPVEKSNKTYYTH
jgi:hypothetical protein